MALDRIDHIAIVVSDIQGAIDWYQQRFNCELIYQDESWAMVQFDNVKLAFVVKKEHPQHFAIEKADASTYGKLTTHRDGRMSIYIQDGDNNIIEILQHED